MSLKNLPLPLITFSVLLIASVPANIIKFSTIFTHPFHNYSTDLNNFLTGAIIIRDHQSPYLYDPAVQSSVQKKLLFPTFYPVVDFLPFRSLPFVAVPFIPLTFLPLVQASFIFTAFILTLWFFQTEILLRLFPRLRTTPGILLFPLGYFPIVASVYVNQISVFLTLILTSVYVFLLHCRPFVAGMLCSLLLVKTNFFLIFFILLVLVVPSRRRFILGCLSVLVPLALFNLLLVPPSALLQYPQFVLNTETAAFGSSPLKNASLPALAIAAILPFFAFRLYSFRDRLSLPSIFFITPILAIPFSGHTLTHDISLLILPILILLQSDSVRHQILGLFLFTTSVYFTSANQTNLLGIILCFTALILLFLQPRFLLSLSRR